MQATHFTPSRPHFTGGPEASRRKSQETKAPDVSQFLGQAKPSPVDVIDFTRRSPLAREARINNAISDFQETVTKPGELLKAFVKGTLSFVSQGKNLLVKMTGQEGTPDAWIHVDDKDTIEALKAAEEKAAEEKSK